MIIIYACQIINEAVLSFLQRAYTHSTPIALHVHNPQRWDEFLWQKTSFLPHQIGIIPHYNHIAIFNLSEKSTAQPSTKLDKNLRQVFVYDEEQPSFEEPGTYFVHQTATKLPKIAIIYRQSGNGWLQVNSHCKSLT